MRDVGRAGSNQLPDPGTTQQTAFANGKADHSLLRVWCLAFPPAGRRRYWLLIVEACPACGGPHAHRGSPDGGVRRGGCGRLRYVLTVRNMHKVAA